MTPWRMTQKRSTVTPTSRTRMTRVTAHGSSSSAEIATSAPPVSALSAIGSAILPKSVTRLRARAIAPSARSVNDAMAKTPNAAIRQPVLCPSSCSKVTRKTGTSSSRATVRALATLTNGASVLATTAGSGSGRRAASRAVWATALARALGVSGRSGRCVPLTDSPRSQVVDTVIGEQVDPDRRGHASRDELPDGDVAARRQPYRGGAVDVRRLVRRATLDDSRAGLPVGTLRDGLHQHLDEVPHPLLGPFSRQRLAESRHTVQPPGDGRPAHLAGAH